MRHYVKFDPDNKKAQQVFQKGSGFTIIGVALLWNDPRFLVAVMESEAKYQDLDLDLNSMSSPLRYCKAKPKQLGRVVPVAEWEARWYSIT